MGTTITYVSGGTTYTVSEIGVQDIFEKKTRRTVVYDLPMANYDIIQEVGSRSRRFTIKGFVTGSTGTAAIRGLPGLTGSVAHTNDLGVSFLPVTTVFYVDVSFGDRASRPLERSFNIEIVEII